MPIIKTLLFFFFFFFFCFFLLLLLFFLFVDIKKLTTVYKTSRVNYYSHCTDLACEGGRLQNHCQSVVSAEMAAD